MQTIEILRERVKRSARITIAPDDAQLPLLAAWAGCFPDGTLVLSSVQVPDAPDREGRLVVEAAVEGTWRRDQAALPLTPTTVRVTFETQGRAEAVFLELRATWTDGSTAVPLVASAQSPGRWVFRPAEGATPRVSGEALRAMGITGEFPDEAAGATWEMSKLVLQLEPRTGDTLLLFADGATASLEFPPARAGTLAPARLQIDTDGSDAWASATVSISGTGSADARPVESSIVVSGTTRSIAIRTPDRKTPLGAAALAKAWGFDLPAIEDGVRALGMQDLGIMEIGAQYAAGSALPERLRIVAGCRFREATLVSAISLPDMVVTAGLAPETSLDLRAWMQELGLPVESVPPLHLNALVCEGALRAPHFFHLTGSVAGPWPVSAGNLDLALDSIDLDLRVRGKQTLFRGNAWTSIDGTKCFASVALASSPERANPQLDITFGLAAGQRLAIGRLATAVLGGEWTVPDVLARAEVSRFVANVQPMSGAFRLAGALDLNAAPLELRVGKASIQLSELALDLERREKLAVSLAASMSVVGAPLMIELGFPGPRARLSLREGETASLRTSLNQLLPGDLEAPAFVPDLVLRKLVIDLDREADTATFTAESETLWELPFLTDTKAGAFRIHASTDPDGGRGTLSGRLAIADSGFDAELSLTPGTKTLVIQQRATPLSFRALLRALAGEGHPFPGPFASLEHWAFEDISGTFDFGVKRLEVNGTLAGAFGDGSAPPARSVTTGAGSGTLGIGAARFTLGVVLGEDKKELSLTQGSEALDLRQVLQSFAPAEALAPAQLDALATVAVSGLRASYDFGSANPAFAATLSVRSLRALAQGFLPEGITLPDEVPGEVAFATLAFSLGSDRALHIEGAVEKLSLPFRLGESELVLDRLAVKLDRSAAGEVGFRIDLDAHGKLNDDLQFPKLAFSFEFQDSRTWKLDGKVEAQVFSERLTLGAGYREAEGNRHVELFYDHAAARPGESPRPLLAIPGFATFDLRRLAFVLDQGKERRAWKVSATTDLHVFSELAGERKTLFRIDEGTLALFDERAPGSHTQGIEFTARDARTGRIPLFAYPTYEETNPQRGPGEAPGYRETGTRTFAFDARFLRASLQRRVGAWSFSAAAGLDFFDPPAPLDVFFARSIDGTLSIDSKEARFTISRLIEDVPVEFPEVPGLSGDGIALGKGVVNLRDIGITIGAGKAALSAKIVVGLPSKLNNFFGVDAAGKPRHQIFRTWAEGGTEQEREESLVRIGLEVGTDGVGGKLESSPFRAFPVEDGYIVLDWTDEKDIGTDKDLGRFELQVPTFKLDLQQGSLKFSGGFRIDEKRGLRLPLTPLKALLRLLSNTRTAPAGEEDAFARLVESLPNSIPVMSLSFFDEDTGELDVARIEKFLGLPLPKELRDALVSVKSVADRLPDRFKHYLNFQLPRDLHFALDVTPDGGVRFNVRSEGSPLKLLLPVGPVDLMGIELTSISLGEVFGGALLIADASLRVDAFSGVELAAGLLIPPEVAKGRLASTRSLRQTFICEELLLFIVYQEGFPIPIPVFFNELGISQMSLVGLEVQSHFYFPRPVFKKDRALALLSDLIAFFSRPDHCLDVNFPPGKPKEGDLNIVFTVGAQYIALPPMFGSTEKTSTRDDYRTYHYPIGFETVRQDANTRTVRMGPVVGYDSEVLRIDTLKLAFILLNALKKRSPTYLLEHLAQELPLERRLGMFDLAFFDRFALQAAWAVTTPHEFVESASELLAQRFEENYRQKTGRRLKATRDTTELLALMPSRGTLAPSGPGGTERPLATDDEGLVVFLRGALQVGDALTMEAAFGLALTDGSGFGTGLMFRGELADVFLLELKGLVKVAAPPRGEARRSLDVVRVAGKAGLVLLGNKVLDGTFEMQVLDDGQFRIGLRGMLDLFPAKLFPNFPLRIYSGKRLDLVRTDEDRYISGHLDNERCAFDGEVHFELGMLQLAGRAFIHSGPAGAGRASEARLELSVMDALLTLHLKQDENNLLLEGSATPMRALGGLLSITDAAGTGGPRAELVVREQKLESFVLTGAASLLGFGGSSTDIRITPERMSFTVRNVLEMPGLHGEAALGCTLVPGRAFAGDGTFALRIDLGELLATVIKQVTRLSFPRIDLSTGISVSLAVRASQETSEDEAAYQARLEAYRQQEEKRRRLKEEGERAIAQASELRASAEKQREAGFRRIREAEEAITGCRSQIDLLENEIAALRQQMEGLPPQASLEQFEATLREWTDRIRRLGDRMAEHEQVISREEAKFSAQLLPLAEALERIGKQKDDLAAEGRYEELSRLEEEERPLEAERAVYNRKVVLIAEARAVSPVERNAREELVRAEAGKAEAERAVNLDETYRQVFGNLDQYLALLRERERLERDADRVLPPLGQVGSSLAFATVQPRRSHLEVTVTTRLFLFGFQIELPFRLVLDDLEKTDWKDHQVLGRIAALILQQLADNALALLAQAAGSFAALAWHLVRMVFDPGYRHDQLGKGSESFARSIDPVAVDAAREEQVLVPVTTDPAHLAALIARQQELQSLIIRRLQNGEGTTPAEIRECLERAGWSKDELDRILQTGGPAVADAGAVRIAS